MNIHAHRFTPAEPPKVETLILVNERNEKIGTDEKLAVHRKGLLHRAFSIFLFDGTGRTLLQRRAATKYHSGGLWANSCCGHPREGEQTRTAAHRRLGEELGLASHLTEGFRARYTTPLDHGLTENELVYVFAGQLTGEQALNPDEVSEVRLVSLDALITDVNSSPQRYAYWLRHYLATHAQDLAELRDKVLSNTLKA
jgi:isopentenyl-diphosphate Delta-isomerase